MEDAFDLLTMLVNALARNGAISEVIHSEAHALIARIDPKIEQKRAAHAAAEAKAAQEYQDFLAYQAYVKAAATAPPAPSSAPPAPANTAAAGPVPAVFTIPAVPVG